MSDHLRYKKRGLPWWIEHGIPRELITGIQKVYFEQVIEEMHLRPLDIEISVPNELNPGSMQLSSVESRGFDELPLFKRIKFPGGIIGPHFHFEGKIYLLDPKQWRKFSKGIVKLFQERLDQVGTIDLKQFARMNETLSTF